MKMLNFLVEKTPIKMLFESLWRDEAFSFFLAKQSIVDIISITAQDFNPPLYYILLHIWIGFFGTSEIILRSLSLLFYLLLVYGAHIFIKNIFLIKKKELWILTLLFSINPFLLYYGFEARMYSLFALLTIFSYYFLYLKKARAYIIVATLGLFTHYFFIFVFGTQIIYSYFFEHTKLEKLKAFFMIPVLAIAPWIIYIFVSISTKTNDFWITHTKGQDFLYSLGILFTGYEPNYYSFYKTPLFYISIFFICFSIYSIQKNIKKPVFLLITMWAFFSYFILLAISLFKPIYTPKYTIYASVGFVMFIIYSLIHTQKKLKLFLYVIVFFISIHYWMIQLENRSKGSSRQTIRMIKSLSTSNDVLYITDAASYFTAAYYFDENKVYIYDTPSHANSYPLPSYIGSVLIPQKRIVQYPPEYPQKAFVVKDDKEFEIETIIQ